MGHGLKTICWWWSFTGARFRNSTVTSPAGKALVKARAYLFGQRVRARRVRRCHANPKQAYISKPCKNTGIQRYKLVGAIVFLLHGVHGDETKYGEYAATVIKQSTSLPWVNKRICQVYSVGPYSLWSSRQEFHFSANLTDPNRLHTKEWNTSSFDLASLILARERLYTLFQEGNLTAETFLKQCKEKFLNIHGLLQRPQTLFDDFFGYTSFPAWSLATSQRRSLSQFIFKTAKDNPGKQLIVLDIHAGIGQPMTSKIIHQTNSQLVRDDHCYLVDGLARDLVGVRIDFFVLELGIKGTRFMFDRVLLELCSRSLSQQGTLLPSLLSSSEEKGWRKGIRENLLTTFLPKLLEIIR